MMIKQVRYNKWADALAVYRKPRVIGMIFLGFSAGLPFLLVFTTLSAWLRDEGVALSTIGFFSWIGITYSIKVFWAPVIDRLPLVWLTKRLGKRRSWMLLAQLLIMAGLLGMACSDTATQLQQLALFALLVAFGSATQDIVIDAYRIEALDKLSQGAMAATYVLGYRLSLLAAGAGSFYLAEIYSWPIAYCCMAALMLSGVFTTLIIREPEHALNAADAQLEAKLESRLGIHNKSSLGGNISAWFVDSVLSPFIEFFQRNGWLALSILLLIGSYRISDITMGVMANPFYLDAGFSKIEIANVTKVFGFFMTILGAGLGGVLVVRYGILRPLLAGAILVVITNLLFILLAVTQPSLMLLALVISVDNLSGGIATSVFIAYLSSLTSTSYTATQYALFSSLMTLPAKVIGGFSGIVVEHIGFASFFFYSAVLGLPAIALVVYMIVQHRRQDRTDWG